jgi:N-sulfoglucosamine sulfohydrolase
MRPVILFLSLGFWVSAVESKPNVLFILTEDQGAQMGYLGTAGLETPHMDSLARSGTYFSNAFVAYPVCSASKACILTGLHSHYNGLLNNTANYHKPAEKLTDGERRRLVYRRSRVKDGIPTLTELLKGAGYYQGVTHKLHLSPNEKFPYDEFLQQNSEASVADFIKRAGDKPWLLFFNIPNSHRPYPNSDKKSIRVKPEGVELPAYLPDTPIVRKDWAEYLAAIEVTDAIVGGGLRALRKSGQEDETIVVFLGDHGPTFQHGKMSLYDLGIRTPMIVRLPGQRDGQTSDALVSELDLTPTLLDLLDLAPLPKTHGISLRPLLEGKADAKGHDLIFAEISHRGALPNDGMQERSVFDGRWKLIYREKFKPAWRQVNADTKDWKPWGNRTWDETIRVKEQFPEAYRILQEMEPQKFGVELGAFELYDTQADPDEMVNLAEKAEVNGERDRLFGALKAWAKRTEDFIGVSVLNAWRRVIGNHWFRFLLKRRQRLRMPKSPTVGSGTGVRR